MNDDNDFDVNNYYGTSDYYDDNNYENNKYSQNQSSYDDVFKSYSSNNVIERKKNKRSWKEKNKKKRNYGNNDYNNNGGNIWLKIVVVVILASIFAVGAIILYKSKDDIIDIINPSNDNVNIEVVLMDSNLDLIVGDEKKLNYQMVNFTDISLLTFASSNTSVAKVDKEGKVKAIAAGEVDISVTYKNESGNVIKKCHVVIKNTDVNKIQVTPIPTSSIQVSVTPYIPNSKQIKEAEERAKQEAIKKAQEAALQKNREANQKAIEEAKKKAQSAQSK